jgi:N-methylhydantoinase A
MILGVDVGGTFTDAVAIDGGAVAGTGKAPTTPDDQSGGVLAAIEEALGDAPSAAVERLVHGMTVGTNALLEGRTARTALIATEGFTDIEELGRQARPELYRLCVAAPPPLVPPDRRVAAPERCGPDGVVRELDAPLLRERLAALDGGVESVAVSLLWGFLHPDHERAVADLAREALPDAHVSTSHETAAVFREYERTTTTVVDAAVSPLLRRYLGRLTERTRSAGLPDAEIMLSSGGVVGASAAAEHGAWTVLSGPAGGAVAAARAARVAGSESAVGLDMGGTSCDVSLILDGDVEVTGGREIAGRELALPMIDIHTVGAGGGSIAWADSGGALRVGPRSAGARPGPACYGLGGTEPTVTDANLLLGLLDADRPLAGDVTLDRDAAADAVGELARELDLSVDETAAGIRRVATSEMAQAVRVVTVERGIDPRELALVAFGGAGPLHGAAIADELGMRRVIAPRESGVLSALGLAVSERRRDVVESVLLSGEDITADAVAGIVARLGARGREELGEPDAELRATYELRYAGQAFELPIHGGPAPSAEGLRAAFDAAHEDRYGYYADADAELELVTVRVAAAVAGTELEFRGLSSELRETGPAVVPLDGSTLAVPQHWTLSTQHSHYLLEREHDEPD